MKPVDAVLEVLRTEGVEMVFGNPGTTELPFVEAVSGADDMEYVLGVHEGAVVAMADGYARVSGRTAFVNLHVAPGVANGLLGILNALRSRTPLVVTAGQQDSRHLVHEPMLSGDLVGMTRPVTKYSVEATRPEDLPLLLRRAFADAATPPTGPVFVSIPMDLLDADVDVVVPDPIHRLSGGVAPGVESAVAILAAATSPVIVAGDAVGREGGVAELVRIAEAIGAPVHHQPMADGINFPTGHPLYAGMIAPTNEAIRQVLSRHDVAFLAGARAFRPHLFRAGAAVPDGVRLVQVDSDPGEIGFAYPPEVGLVGGVRETLAALADEFAGPTKGAIDRSRDLTAAIATERASVAKMARHLESDAPFHPLSAVHALAESLPDGTIVVEEAITTGIELRKVLRQSPGAYMHTVGGGLGWGIGAAVGAALAARDPVIAVVGDGCATFGLHGLWSAARLGVPVLFMVMNNHEYRTLKQQVLDRGRVEKAAHSDALNLVDPAIDFVQVARGLGVDGHRISSLGELRELVTSLPHRTGPMLLDIPLMRLDPAS